MSPIEGHAVRGDRILRARAARRGGRAASRLAIAITPRVLALILFVAGSAGAAARGLDFAQFDASSDSATAVLVRAWGDPRAAQPAPVASASATRWRDGEVASAGVVARRTLATPGEHTLRGGLGAGVDHFHSRAPGDGGRRDGASLRVQIEADGPAGAGGLRYYALAQAASWRRQWFASAQVTGARVGAELSRVGDEGYGATSAVLRLALDGVFGVPRASGWSLRIGAVRDEAGTRALIGIGYNGF